MPPMLLMQLDAPRLPWGERFLATDYVEFVFQPISLALLVFVVGVLYFSKVMYAGRYVVSEMLFGNKIKRANRKERNTRRKQRRASRLAAPGDDDTEAAVDGSGAAEDEDAPSQAGAGVDLGDVELAEVDGGADEAGADEESKGDVAGDDDGSDNDGAGLVVSAKTHTTLGDEEMGEIPHEAIAAARRAAAADHERLLQGTSKPTASRPDGIGWLEWELVTNDNPAVAISYTSFVFALCIILTGPRTPANPDDKFFTQLFDVVIWSSFGIAALVVANFICSKLIMSSFLAQKGILSGNSATGLIEAGSYIGSSFIIRASLSGDSSSDDFLSAFGAACVYFILGQLLLVVSTLLLQRITPYDDQEEASKGNIAAGVKFCGNLVSMGIVVSSPVLKTDSILAYAVFVVGGPIILVLLRMFINRALLPGRDIDKEIAEDQNWGLAVVEASITVSIALVLGSMLPDLSCKVVVL